ncbi:Protein of unknown function [Poseidonocella pacifica]|uniref:Flagellar protein n=1 Tax=Poseidonocella pacifica TaxID=871651 RepID=A0A1I0XXU5_9RHOB|nr:DUF1217 domain-containing protein [Poseidonocella pacifica]SFB05487.1 Protein of unknown function [Poseidonocella pacifica]
MSFSPIILGTGLMGWRFLESTISTQKAAFEESAVIQRDIDYFAEKIGDVSTAEDLMSDRRLLSVALGAFGLDEDINNTYFIRKVLEEGTVADDALANRLSDSRYEELAGAFAFGDRPVPRTKLSTFADEITSRFVSAQFEIAVGEQDNNMRLALNAERALPEILESDSTENSKWFQIMGTSALRTVFETALGLPSNFSQIDLDQQLDVFKEKASRQFNINSIEDFQDEEKMGKLVDTFLLRSQLTTDGTTSSNSIALTLLTGY